MLKVNRIEEKNNLIRKLKDEAWDYHDNHGYPNNYLEERIANEELELKRLKQEREIRNKE